MSPFLLAGFIAVAIVLSIELLWRLPRQAQRQRREALATVARAMAVRAPHWAAHTETVRELADDLAVHLACSSESRERLSALVSLRDVGLAEVPYAQLQRPESTWTKAEQIAFAEHPERGAQFLASVPALAEFAPLLADRFAPARETPAIETRILRLAADIVWLEHRFGIAEARTRILEGVGEVYDPTVVDAWLSTQSSGYERIPEPAVA